MRFRPTLLLLTAALPWLGMEVAQGQDALGRGDALDSNLSTTGGRFNAPARQDNFRQRNLMITDDVVGGRGFRGSVGYTAESDFRGLLGSDALFGFRADSAWSDISFINRGDTYQRLRFGENLGLVEYRREFTGATGSRLADGLQPSQELINSQLRLDQVGASTSLSEQVDDLAEPMRLGTFRDAQGSPYSISVSGLRGVAMTPQTQDASLLGLSSYDAARIQDDVRQERRFGMIGAAYEVSYDAEALLERLNTDRDRLGALAEAREPRLVEPRESQVPDDERPGLVRTRVDSEAEPEFLRIQQRLAERTLTLRLDDRDMSEPGTEDDEQAEIEQLQQDLNRLRSTLTTGAPGTDEQDDDEQTDGESRDGTQRPATPEERREARQREGLGSPSLPGEGVRQGMRERREQDMRDIEDRSDAREFPRRTVEQLLTERHLAEILRHGERITNLSGGDPTRFNELVSEGEEKLRTGEYFLADRRFAQALRLQPGHPLATAGLAHAQLGAGYYLSAAYTLHSLFSNQPEMIDARYEEGLVPNRPRLDRAVEVLEKRLPSETDRASNAFLLAYLGRLSGERAVIERGLDALEQSDPNDPLLPLLRAIWLEGQSPAEATGDAKKDVRPSAEPARTADPPAEETPEK
jgi:hypothetical protein